MKLKVKKATVCKLALKEKDIPEKIVCVTSFKIHKT